MKSEKEELIESEKEKINEIINNERNKKNLIISSFAIISLFQSIISYLI